MVCCQAKHMYGPVCPAELHFMSDLVCITMHCVSTHDNYIPKPLLLIQGASSALLCSLPLSLSHDCLQLLCNAQSVLCHGVTQ